MLRLYALCTLWVTARAWSKWRWDEQREPTYPPGCVLGEDGDWSTITGTGANDCKLDLLGVKEGVDPGARRGHTLTLRPDTQELILFGGRGNDDFTFHRPKTYEIQEIKGKLVFTSYEDRYVTPLPDVCNAPAGNASGGANGTGSADLPPECDARVPVGTFYNDIWSYNITCK